MFNRKYSEAAVHLGLVNDNILPWSVHIRKSPTSLENSEDYVLNACVVDAK